MAAGVCRLALGVRDYTQRAAACGVRDSVRQDGRAFASEKVALHGISCVHACIRRGCTAASVCKVVGVGGSWLLFIHLCALKERRGLAEGRCVSKGCWP